MSSNGYGQFCPVAKACEVIAERWTPLVLRELLAGSHHFSQLHRGVRNMSRTLLAKRLRELEAAGIVRSEGKASGHGREYHLTQSGEELREVIMQLGIWGQRWAQREIDQADLDAELLMVDIQRRVDQRALPEGTTVLRFDFRELPRYPARPKIWWLVLEQREVDLCFRSPGLPVAVVVSAQLRAFAEVWIGHKKLADAVREGLVSFEGPRHLVRELPSWLKLSPFANVPAMAQAAS